MPYKITLNTQGNIESHNCSTRYTVKKRLAIFPSPAGMLLTKLSLAGNNLLFPGYGEFDSDIPAGDGNIANLF
jgi:hypothetical protein